MTTAAHDQARVEGRAFAKRYWETAGFTLTGSDKLAFAFVAPKVPAELGTFAIYQMPTGIITPAVRTFITNSALAAIENEAGALASTRQKWTDSSIVVAWKEAAQGEAVQLLHEVARFPAPSGR